MNQIEVDFYEDFYLPTPISGLVHKITSPKGIRKEVQGGYEYHLKHDLIQIYEKDSIIVGEGLYWVLDIHIHHGNVVWNHYLFVVDNDDAHLVAEFMNITDSTWIKDAMPVIKKYFEGKPLKDIEATQYIEDEEDEGTKPWTQK